MSTRRVQAVFRKELREYRRNGAIIVTMAVIPIVFVVQPLVALLVASGKASRALAHQNLLLYVLAVPAIVPATLASYAVVGERQQGTLEPVLTSPVRREEFLLGKALAAFVPSVGISYAVVGVFIAVVELFADAGIAHAVIRGPEVVAQVVFTPLIAALSIWVGIGISARTNDVRTAQQLATLASLPTVAGTSLIAYQVIPATKSVAVAFGAALVILDRVGWRVTSAAFDRERLITNTK
ncbi:MAG TPA: ABC transporter permease subunit [Acidimicrobiales bacterium]|nr:ABC transporter permease subunit [Acidimicrobiales bacterium]